jgi:predicted ATP-grasp superfamily ATP-dependent carboligase
MPRVFVYEHVTATGFGRDPASPEHSLFVEGRAMLSAVSADFAAVSGVELITFPDDAPPDTFARLAASSDWTLVIAPETGGELERLDWESSAWFAPAGHQLRFVETHSRGALGVGRCADTEVFHDT